ncbi:hypothetical protein [Vibrio harveyi]|uniref:hypothetical protein n=1 Tax=Vibrio harveyi TaxID=669 RepID=UPI00248044B6|nr:hypothetical protein [Vibrio harveyi]
MGVLSFNGNNVVTVGIIDKKEDLISSTKNAVALAPSLKLAVRHFTGGEISLDNGLSEHDLFNCFICKLNGTRYYACAFIDERIIFDFELNDNANEIAEKIATELSDNILFDTEKYAVALHYIDCNDDIPTALNLAVKQLREFQEEQLIIANEHPLEITLSDLLNEAPKNELLFVKNIAKLSQGSSKSETIISFTVIAIAIIFVVWWFFLTPPHKPDTDQATLDKYSSPVKSVLDEPQHKPDSVQTHDPVEDANNLRQIEQEEHSWIENAIRKNGHKPLSHLGQALEVLDYSVDGFILDEVAYDDNFAPTRTSLTGYLLAKYNRTTKSTIEDFLKRYPDAQITLDGEVAFLNAPFQKSTHEKRFWFTSNSLKLETLISRLQRLKDDQQISTWSVRKDNAPKRPRSYTSKEQSLMARMGIKESEKEDAWITQFEVFRVVMTFRYVSNLPNFEKVFEGFPTALLANFKYQASSQTATIEVQLYDIQ